MTTFRNILLSASVAASFATASVAAEVPLRDVPQIDNNMLGVALAIEISSKCDRIAPRKLKGLNYLWGLKRKAAELGYSDEEITAYVESDEEEARIRKLGEAYVNGAGFDPKSAEDLCKLGEVEIAKNSLIGSLLRRTN